MILKSFIRSYFVLGLLAAAVLVAGRVASAKDAKLTVTKNAGKVTFTAIGQPSALKIEGKGEGPEGNIDVKDAAGKLLASGKLAFGLDSLDTGIEMRNHHMKEKYLETGKYPKAELAIESLSIPQALAAGNGEASVPFTGNLNLHGVQKPVSGTAVLKRNGGALDTNATFKLNLADYQVAIPKFAGITIAKDVDVAVNFNVAIPADLEKKDAPATQAAPAQKKKTEK